MHGQDPSCASPTPKSDVESGYDADDAPRYAYNISVETVKGTASLDAGAEQDVAGCPLGAAVSPEGAAAPSGVRADGDAAFSFKLERDAVADLPAAPPTLRSPGVYIYAEPADDAAMNGTLRAHADASDWEHGKVAGELYEWFGILNAELFAGALPLAAISVDYARAPNLGTYRYNRDGLALKYRINLNSQHVYKSAALRIAVLLHEMIHLWEDAVQDRRPRWNYHSRDFQTKAAELGIPTNKRGTILGIAPDGPLASLLERHGVPLGDGAVGGTPAASARTAGSNRRQCLRKWSCECASAWVAAKTHVFLKCEACGQVLAPSS